MPEYKTVPPLRLPLTPVPVRVNSSRRCTFSASVCPPGRRDWIIKSPDEPPNRRRRAGDYDTITAVLELLFAKAGVGDEFSAVLPQHTVALCLHIPDKIIAGKTSFHCKMDRPAQPELPAVSLNRLA